MCVCVSMHVSAGAKGALRGWTALELELQAGVSHLTGELGIDLVSPGRAVYTLNQWVILWGPNTLLHKPVSEFTVPADLGTRSQA